MDALAVHEGAAGHEVHAESFVRHYIFSLDHKMIGKQYYLTTLFMAMVGGALAMLMRAHLGWPQNGVIDPGQYLAAARYCPGSRVARCGQPRLARISIASPPPTIAIRRVVR